MHILDNAERVYIASPTDTATGGTELLQQLCAELNKNGHDAMMYYTSQYKDSPIQNKFGSYGNKIAEKLPDNNSVVIVPETHIHVLYSLKNVKKCIWWLSVDNYSGSFKRQYDLAHSMVYKFRHARNMKEFKDSLHLVQSEYARLYVTQQLKIAESRVAYLSDYLNDEFLKYIKNNEKKDNVILYNPKKGFEFTQKIMEQIPEYKWIPLAGLTREEMIHHLCTSKVYIDFGNHPGKDRIPREAAICGCCVITGKRGAAGNDIDVKIDKCFKFEDNVSNIPEIHRIIAGFMEDYENERVKFDAYRESILEEKEKFHRDVKLIFG